MLTATLLSATIFALASTASGHSSHGADDQAPLTEDRITRWKSGYTFTGIQTFAHLPHVECLVDQEASFDIAVIGAPFDTSVAYRPGARFGPRAIRSASQRQIPSRGFNPVQGINPYQNWATFLDCGDIPITPFDNAVAFTQMTEAYRDLLRRPARTQPTAATPGVKGKDGVYHPRLMTLGGDHSVALPALRALNEIYGPISVLHFDSHLDTWAPNNLAGYWSSAQSDFTHGSMFWIAHNEGLIANGTNIHAGLRSRIFGGDFADYDDDARQGFHYIETHEIDEIGVKGIADTIKQVVGDSLVYLSIDIDILEPGLAPGTGAPEPGGWTTREVKAILRSLTSLNIVGADVVEVAPQYDDAGESTAWAASDLIFEVFGLMVGKPLYPVDGYVERKTHNRAPRPNEQVVREGVKTEL